MISTMVLPQIIPMSLKCKFSKSIFELLCIVYRKSLLGTWEVKIRSRSPEVIKCKFSKKCISELICAEKTFWTSEEVKLKVRLQSINAKAYV